MGAAILMASLGNDQFLEGRVVLVTGAARRIGAALARGCHGSGADVVIHYGGSRDEAEALVADLNGSRPRSAVIAQADLLIEDAPRKLVDAATDAYGRLDVLINNASTFYPTPLGSIDENVWRDLVGTNLKAPLFVSQAAAPHLRERGGAIINMVDIHARRPLPRHPVYTAAKAGLAALTLSLAQDLGPEIRVNGIAPGAILWPEGEQDEDARKAILEQTCLGRSGNPQDIVPCALYLLRADNVTGQIIEVDGGRSIGW